MRTSSHSFATSLRQNKILDFAGPSIRSATALEYDLGERGPVGRRCAVASCASAGSGKGVDRVIGFVSQKNSGIVN
jgi:hypothetical protein